MVFHLVLFRPKSDLPEQERQRFLDAVSAAATRIPGVLRFMVGERLRLGRTYDAAMDEDFPYAAVIEFQDAEGLRGYLEHPEHEELGVLFYQCAERALVYDYRMRAAAADAI